MVRLAFQICCARGAVHFGLHTIIAAHSLRELALSRHRALVIGSAAHRLALALSVGTLQVQTGLAQRIGGFAGRTGVLGGVAESAAAVVVLGARFAIAELGRTECTANY